MRLCDFLMTMNYSLTGTPIIIITMGWNTFNILRGYIKT